MNDPPQGLEQCQAEGMKNVCTTGTLFAAGAEGLMCVSGRFKASLFRGKLGDNEKAESCEQKKRSSQSSQSRTAKKTRGRSTI